MCCVLFDKSCALCTACYLLLVVRYVLHGVFLFVVSCLVCVVHGVLRVVCCLLIGACWLLFVARCVLPVVCCLLPAACCLSFVVRCA